MTGRWHHSRSQREGSEVHVPGARCQTPGFRSQLLPKSRKSPGTWPLAASALSAAGSHTGRRGGLRRCPQEPASGRAPADGGGDRAGQLQQLPDGLLAARRRFGERSLAARSGRFRSEHLVRHEGDPAVPQAARPVSAAGARLGGHLEAGSNNREFWVWERLNEQPVLVGRTSMAEGRRGADLPIRPDVLLDVLGVGDLPAETTGPERAGILGSPRQTINWFSCPRR